jgi:hypothetical protein
MIGATVLFRLVQTECYNPPMLNLEDMAEIVGVPVAQLRLWLDTEKIKSTTTYKSNQVMTGSENVYHFSEDDIEPIRRFAKMHSAPKQRPKEQFVDDGEQENFTVAQIASLWQLSTDTIQRVFENEPGVLPLGNRNPRGKRKRITLRIPRAVMERVKRKRSNP